MAVRTEELQLRVLIDGSPARKELAQLDQEYAKLNSDMKDLAKNSKEWIAANERVGQIGARQAELRKEIGLTGLTAKQLGDELRRLQVVQRNLTPNTPMWVENARRINDVKLRLKQLNDVNLLANAAWEKQRQGMRLTSMSMLQLQMEAQRLKRRLETMDPESAMFRRTKRELDQVDARIKSVGGTGVWAQMKAGLTSTAASVIGWGAALYGAGRVLSDMLGTIREFDKALSPIKALGGEYASSIKEIGEAAKTAGTDFGFSAVQSLSAVEALAKAGVGAKDILGGSLSGALTLAAAGSMEVGEAAEVAANTMVQFGLKGKDVGRIADLLAAGAANASGEVSDMAMAMKQSGLVVSQMGIPLEQAVGTLTAFASAGLLGSDAGTSFRTMLLRLQNPATDAQESMKKLGISVYDANGNFRGLGDLAGQLQTKLGRLTAEQRNQALATIFGSDAVRAATVLYNQGSEGLEKYTDLVNQTGFAQRVAAEQTNNWSGDIGRLSAKWEQFVLGLEGSEGRISTVFRSATQWVSGLLDTLDAFNKQSGQAKDFEKDMDAVFAKMNAGRENFRKLSTDIPAFEEITKKYQQVVQSVKENEDAEERLSTAIDLRAQSLERVRQLQGDIDKQGTNPSRRLEFELGAAKAAVIQTQRIIDEGEKSKAAAAVAAAEAAKRQEEEAKAAEAARKAQRAAETADKSKERKEQEAHLAKVVEDLQKHLDRIHDATLTDDQRALEQLKRSNAEKLEQMKLIHAEQLKAGVITAPQAESQQTELVRTNTVDEETLVRTQAEARLKVLRETNATIQQQLGESHNLQLQEDVQFYAKELELAKLSGKDIAGAEKNLQDAELRLITANAEDKLEKELKEWNDRIAQAKEKLKEFQDAQTATGTPATEEEQAEIDATETSIVQAELAINEALADVQRARLQEEKANLEKSRLANRAHYAEQLQKVATWANAVGGVLGGLMQIRDAEISVAEQRADADGVRTAQETANIEQLKEARKRAALFHIGVQAAAAVASGISSAMASPVGFPGNLLAAAGSIVSVLGLIAQARSILGETSAYEGAPAGSAAAAATPSSLPTGAKGGVFEGPSHDHGGLKVVDPIANRVVAEVEGGEPWMVLSKAFRTKNPNLIPLLLKASAEGAELNLKQRPPNGGGVTLQHDGDSGQLRTSGRGVFAAVPAFNFARANEAMELAQGGVIDGRRIYNPRGTALVNLGGAPQASSDTISLFNSAASQRSGMGGATTENSNMEALLGELLGEVRKGTWAKVSQQDLKRKTIEYDAIRAANRVKKTAA